MASFKMNIPYKLSQQEALQRTRHLMSSLQQEHKDKISDVKENWNTNSGTFQFNAMGFNLSGTINVLPGNIILDAQVPFGVMFFKGKIRKLIEEKANELLAE